MESQKEIHTVLLKLHMHGIEIMIQVIAYERVLTPYLR